MKGQVFITLSIFVVIALLMLSIGFVEVHKTENYMQDYFVNIRTELVNTVDDSLIYGEDISANLDSYIMFSERALSSKGYEQDITYTISGNDVTLDIYLAKGEEYYRDIITVERRSLL